MNGRFGWAVLLFVLMAAAVGVVSYNAGVSHALATNGNYRPWGWGLGFGPIFLLGFWFLMLAAFRGLFWMGRYRRCGYGPGWRHDAFDEWHRRAHEEMNKKS